MGLLLGAPWQRLNPATLEGMEAMAATEVATTVASEDCTTSARGLLMPRLMLNPASTVALEGMEDMADMAATTVASGDCTTSARGLLMPRLMLNPDSTVALEGMGAMAAMVATMVASEACTTSARGLLMLNPATLAMEAMAATGVASMVASEDTTADKLKTVYRQTQRPSKIVT